MSVIHPQVAGRPCSVAAALEIVGDRWSLLAVREVNFGNHRFNEIVRNTGAPRDRLAQRLKDLVAAGVLERRSAPEAPARAGYYLSEAGRELVPVLQALRQWGDRWAVDRPALTVRHRDHDFVPSVICATCGEVADPDDLERVSNDPAWDVRGPVG